MVYIAFTLLSSAVLIYSTNFCLINDVSIILYVTIRRNLICKNTKSYPHVNILFDKRSSSEVSKCGALSMSALSLPALSLPALSLPALSLSKCRSVEVSKCGALSMSKCRSAVH